MLAKPTAFMLLLMVWSSIQGTESNSPKLIKYFNVNNGQNGYYFMYATDDGTEREEKGECINGIWTVIGNVRWITPEGSEFTMNYISDGKGYNAQTRISNQIFRPPYEGFYQPEKPIPYQPEHVPFDQFGAYPPGFYQPEKPIPHQPEHVPFDQFGAYPPGFYQPEITIPYQPQQFPSYSGGGYSSGALKTFGGNSYGGIKDLQPIGPNTLWKGRSG